jgi:polyhydroxyalkanoate synthesis regulator phasin
MSTNLSTEEKLKFMAEVQRSVVDYLTDEININTNALKAYEPNAMDDVNRDPDVKRIREIEAIKLRDRITELSRHIAVIKRMYPNA